MIDGTIRSHSPHEGQVNPPNPALDSEYFPQCQPFEGNFSTHRATAAIHHAPPRQKVTRQVPRRVCTG